MIAYKMALIIGLGRRHRHGGSLVCGGLLSDGMVIPAWTFSFLRFCNRYCIGNPLNSSTLITIFMIIALTRYSAHGDNRLLHCPCLYEVALGVFNFM